MMAILLPWLITVVVEALVYQIYMCLMHDVHGSYQKDLFWINSFTNPLLNVVIQLFLITSQSLIWMFEIVVVMIEMILHQKMGHGTYLQCLLISLLTNIASYMIGGFIYAYFF